MASSFLEVLYKQLPECLLNWTYEDSGARVLDHALASIERLLCSSKVALSTRLRHTLYTAPDPHGALRHAACLL